MQRQRFLGIRKTGSALIEVMISIGVLALVIPLVFCVLAESEKAGQLSEAKTRSSWIVPICVSEIRASRLGLSQFFSVTESGKSLPPLEEFWVLAFTANGILLGRINKAEYDLGLAKLQGQDIRYLAVLSAIPLPVDVGMPVITQVKIRLEYPAAAPAIKRQISDFFTQLP